MKFSVRLSGLAAVVSFFALAMQLSAFATDPAFSHCCYQEMSLDGAWEMSYRPCPFPREERSRPDFTGVRVEHAIPGYWEDMIEVFRASGMTDEFQIHPLYRRQTLPISGWARDTTLPNISGCFLYRRTVTLPSVSEDAVLSFEGVRNQVHVWINGRFVALRQGFSTPFELAVSKGILHEGDNEIVLAVSNGPTLGFCDYVTGLTTRGLFAGTGGVNGHLALRFLKNDVSDVYVTTARDLQTMTIHVGGTTACDYEIVDGSRTMSKGRLKGEATLSTAGLAFWSPEHPKRYRLRLRSATGETFEQFFGIRRLTAEGERFFLNGKPYYLRGVTEHGYFPTTVHLPRDLAYYRMITVRRKELGFNFVRFHTFVPPVEYLEALDELGMVAHIESPNFVPETEYAAIVAFARRHPSVVIYSTGNETRIDRIAETYLEDVAGMVHRMTDALFTPMSAMRGVEYALVPGKDKIVSEPFEHNAERLARLAKFSDCWTSFQLSATSYDSLNGASSETLDRWGDAYADKPRTSHEICIDGSYPDLGLEDLYPKDSPVLKAGVFAEIRRQLECRGLVDRADIYFRNSCEWMRRIRKFTFEKLRRCRRTAGFDFLGDINTHWHTFGYFVGMMDEFYRLKPGETVENVLRYNSAAVLLSDLGSDFVVPAGMPKTVAFEVSNYAGEANDATLKCELVRTDGSPIWSAERCVGDVDNGRVAKLGSFSVAVPDVGKPAKYLLRATLSGREVRTSNEWELYAFPAVGDSPNALPSDVRIVKDISKDELLDSMARGERVLLIGAGPFKSLESTYRIGMAGRCSGNLATIVRRHPSLGDFPHEGWCGWQFRRMMEGGRAVQLEAGVPFCPIIEVASSEKQIIRQAFLFEYAVGKGRLLVCSLRLGSNDPASAWLRKRLVEYASSEAFRPQQSLTAGQLAAVLDAPLLSGEANRNVARNVNDYSSEVRAGSAAQP